MGRKTQYNHLTTPELINQINPENKALEADFLNYLKSIDRSHGTIKGYKSDLDIFFVWVLNNLDNKRFQDITKRELVRFQNWLIQDNGNSSSRIRRIKSAISSLSGFIESVLDEEEEYKDFKPIIRKIESPVLQPVREKTILTMEELQPLLDHLVESKEYMKACVLALAMFSGRRKAELTRFKASYFTNDNLICDGALYKTPEMVVTKGRGSGGKLLYVYTLAKPFKPYLDLWLQERERLGVETDWLFPRQENGRWLDEHIGVSTMNSYARSFSSFLNKDIYFHSFRHLWCSYMLEQNLPEAVVQMIQGWASREMVSIYDDRSEDSLLEKYFGSDGIKQVEQKTLDDM